MKRDSRALKILSAAALLAGLLFGLLALSNRGADDNASLTARCIICGALGAGLWLLTWLWRRVAAR